MQDMSSVTEPRQLDGAELDVVSGGLALGANLVGNQLTLTLGNSTFVRTLTPTQAQNLQAAYDSAKAGNFDSLSADFRFLRAVAGIF